MVCNPKVALVSDLRAQLFFFIYFGLTTLYFGTFLRFRKCTKCKGWLFVFVDIYIFIFFGIILTIGLSICSRLRE